MDEVVLFNKPYGVLCQFSGPEARTTLAGYLPQRDIYPAGRLDADSEGLVVLTADGALQHRIADPHHKLPKTYYVEVEGEPSADSVAKLKAGVVLPGYVTRPADASLVSTPGWLWARVPPVRIRRHIPTAWLCLVLREGKNRQVRRMTAAIGHPTLRLIRYSVGGWTITGIAPGEWAAAPISAATLVPPDVSRNTRSRLSTALRSRR
jgi:23S rRNA pseudouridine2457 synthase